MTDIRPVGHALRLRMLNEAAQNLDSAAALIGTATLMPETDDDGIMCADRHHMLAVARLNILTAHDLVFAANNPKDRTP